MAFDNGSRDRETKTNMPSEMLFLRAHRVESVKDGLARFFGNAWAFVVDADSNFVADMGRRDFDQSARRREADRIVDDVVDRSTQPVDVTKHDRGRHARSGEGDSSVALLAAMLPGIDELLDDGAEVDGFEFCPGKLGVGSCGRADVADQAIEADDVILGNHQQFRLEIGVLYPVEAVE